MKYILVFLLMISPAMAETWASGDCTIANGHTVKYAVHNSKGVIQWDGGAPAPMYTTYENNMGIIHQIGNKGNMVMAVDVNTGRAYVITQFDDGRKVENNVFCKLSTFER
jgi:hypothetical protein